MTFFVMIISTFANTIAVVKVAIDAGATGHSK
jgi:hypothetical protein